MKGEGPEFHRANDQDEEGLSRITLALNLLVCYTE